VYRKHRNVLSGLRRRGARAAFLFSMDVLRKECKWEPRKGSGLSEAKIEPKRGSTDTLWLGRIGRTTLSRWRRNFSSALSARRWKRRQGDDGGWPLFFQAARTRQSNSTYATALLLLALHELSSTAYFDTAFAAGIHTAIEQARAWLHARAPKDGQYWKSSSP
jgi:hypothetical protein